MKTTMKKLAAYLLALLLVLQIVPVVAAQEDYTSGTLAPKQNVEYRDLLKVETKASILPVGSTVQLTYTEGYNLTWFSTNEDVATVDDNGLVTAVAPGEVKITAVEGSYQDSVTIKVMGAEPETAGETASEKMVIVINAGKDKIDYDGQEHVSTFMPVSNAEGFDPEKVEINPEKLVRATDCSTYPVKYEASDFTYDGSTENVEFIVSDGWMQIKPVKVTIKADDQVKIEDEDDPEFTATITGRISEDDQFEFSFERDPGEEIGTKVIRVTGADIQGNYRVEYLEGTLEIQAKGLSGRYLLGLSQYKALLTATETTIDGEKRLKAVAYQEAGGGLIYPTEFDDFWTFAPQASGKVYISSNGRYLNIANKKLTLSGTPQELTVEDLGNGKIAIRNDDIVRVNLKSNSIDKGFQGSDWNKATTAQSNETFTLYRGVYAPAENQGVVKFDTNSGGKVKAPDTQIADLDSTITLPKMNETNNGAEFLGWSDVSDITKKAPGKNNSYRDIYPAGSQYTVKNDMTTLYALWNNRSLEVQFGIRKDGQIQDEPNDYSTSMYIGHFKVKNAAKKGIWVIDVNPNKQVAGNHLANDVTANLAHIPTDQEIIDALKKDGNVDFDPETQYIHWYVMKWAGTSLHVDGVIRSKASTAASVMYKTNVPAEEGTDIGNMPAGFQTEIGTEIEAGADKSGKVSEPTREGYTFDGWNTEADGSGQAYSSTEAMVVSENVTLYAQWTDKLGHKVTIARDWPEDKIAYYGAEIKYYIVSMEGFSDNYTLQWEYSTDQVNWTPVEGANEETYTNILDETTAKYYWRVVATDLKE